MVKLTLVHLLSMTCGAQRDPWSESFLRTTSVCKLPSPCFHSLSALSVPFSPSQPWSTRRQVALLASLLLHAPAYLHLASLRLFLAQIRRLLLLLLPLPGPWCGLPPCRRRLGGASSSCHGGMPCCCGIPSQLKSDKIIETNYIRTNYIRTWAVLRYFIALRTLSNSIPLVICDSRCAAS